VTGVDGVSGGKEGFWGWWENGLTCRTDLRTPDEFLLRMGLLS